MRLLMITNTIPFPPRNGLELPIAKLVNYLGERHHVDLLVIHENRSDFNARAGLNDTKFQSLFFLQGKPIPTWKRVGRELIGSAPAFYKYDFATDELTALAKGMTYDLVWVCTPGNFTFLQSCEALGIGQFGKVVLGLNDLATSIYAKHIQELWHRKALDYRFLSFWARSFFIARIERKYLLEYDSVHVQTDKEKAKAIKLLGKKAHKVPFIVAPNGVKTELFSCQYQGASTTVILMMTHLNGDRSEESAWFMRKVWPQIRQQTDAMLWLVGTPPNQDIPHITNDDRMVIKGYVPSLKELYQQVRLKVVPIFHNCGLINRIQDGLAAGVPVVSTSMAASTFPSLAAGKHLIVADGPDQFAQQVIALYQNPQQRALLSAHGRAYAQQLPTWKDTTQHIEHALLSIINHSGRLTSIPSIPVKKMTVI